MKNQKHSVVVGKSAGPRLNWQAKFDQALDPSRKRTWSCPAKTNSMTAANFGWWLKNYES